MENFQDKQMIPEQRQMMETGTKFRAIALYGNRSSASDTDNSPDSGISSDSAPEDGQLEILGNLQKSREAEKAESEKLKKNLRTQNILRIISTLLLCAVSLTFYSTLVVSKFRAFLNDGISSVLVYDLFGLSRESENTNAATNINRSLLSILGTTLKKPDNLITSPYYPGRQLKDSDNDSTSESSDNLKNSGSSEKSSGDLYYPIVKMDLSSKADNGLTFHNETTYSPDAEAILASAVPISNVSEIYAEYGSDAPVILIIHTHGTEAYSPEDSTQYSESENFRSDDITQNVVSVGAVMAEVFTKNGINTIHCTIMHDKESYRDSYIRSLETIKSFTEKHPSIQYIFDVHRDSIISSDMKCIRPVADVDGEEAAQFMTVVGTDFKGADHPDWEKNNLSVAVHLQDSLAEKYPGLVRSINLRGAGFNAQYAPGSLLLEVGTCGNTLSQAKKTAKVVAEELAEIILHPDSSGEYFS